jgi:gliding motility-associated-like protein
MQKKVLSFFIFLFTLNLSAQVVLMDEANNELTFAACSGTFCGSEGPFSGGDYLINQDYTITICPDLVGDPVSLDFTVFDLDASGVDDQMNIYDGSNTDAPLIGEYLGSQLEGLVVTASNSNPDGCLTISFTSNGVGEGSFLASIGCGIPCERPIAVVTDDAPNLRKICVNQLVSFDASASIQTGGFTIENYFWNFDDGSIDTTSGPFVSHSFTEPGQYKVSLRLTNNDGCVNSNSIDLIFLVSTYPSFNPISTDSIICVGEALDLSATPNNYEVTYTNIPELVIGPPNIFPDCAGESFETILTFEDFAPQQNLENIDDLLSICINMEHSFSSDLEIVIECPDGNQVILKEWPALGSSMFLGEPTDFDNTANPDDCTDPLNNIAGNGYDYCWTSANNAGTWGINSGIYYYNFIDNQGNPNTNQPYLPAGDYASDNPLNNLVGCSLNGDWKLIVTDNISVDNGNLFGWSINFAPEIYPALEEFTPQIGLDSDSSFWAGSNIINSSPSLDTISIQHFSDGVYPYIYTVVNNHGCSFTDTIAITVEFPPVIEIFTDSIKICADSIQLLTTVNGIALPANDNENYFFLWNPATGLSDPTAHSPMVLIDTTITYTVTVYKQYHPTCTASDSVTVDGLPNAVATTSDTLICGVTQFQLVAIPADTNFYNAYWQNSNISLSIDDSLAFAANITASQSGYFDFIWTIENGWCTKTDTTHISISLPINIEFTNQTPSCADSCDGSSVAIVTGGFQNNSVQGYNFQWSNGSNDYFTDSLCKGNYSVIVSDSLGCNNSNQFNLIEVLPLDYNLIVKNILCFGNCDGLIEIVCPNAIDFSFDNGNTFSDNNIVTDCAGDYQVIFRNIFGCFIDTLITITEPLPIVAEFSMSPQPTNTNDTRISFINQTTPTSVGSNYWTFNTNNPLGISLNENPLFIFPNDSGGVYPVSLIFKDKYGCKDTIEHNVVIFDEVIAYIPNSFTPNGDGLNDVFYATLLSDDLASFFIVVYNRKGEIVYQSSNPNSGWDGTDLKTKNELPSNVYVYELKVKSVITKEDKIFNGSVTLIR